MNTLNINNKTILTRAACGLAALACLVAPALRPRSAAAQAPKLPDLVVNGIANYYDASGKLDPNYVRVYVFNKGTANSSVCKLGFYQWAGTPNWPQINTTTVWALHPGHGRFVVVPTPTNIHAESKVFKFVVDDANTMSELSETNNTYIVNNL